MFTSNWCYFVSFVSFVVLPFFANSDSTRKFPPADGSPLFLCYYVPQANVPLWAVQDRIRTINSRNQALARAGQNIGAAPQHASVLSYLHFVDTRSLKPEIRFSRGKDKDVVWEN